MKRLLVIVGLVLVSQIGAEEYATTDSGLRVLLADDGTWTYITMPEIDSKWQTSVKTDPLDDTRIITYLLRADSGESSWGTPIYLVLRDTGTELQFFINWQEYLGSEIIVTHRVDSQQAITQEWGISTDSKATFYPRRGNPSTLQLIRQITEAQQFVTRCTPYGENPTTAIFDIRGLNLVFSELGTVVPED